MQTQPRSLVFLIHGFMGHPDEFGPLIPYLEAHGYDTHRVCLPEHGNNPGNLGRITWEDMLERCQIDLDGVSSQYETIHLVGFSLGGALSIVLSQKNPRVFQSATLVAAPYKSVFNLEYGQYHLKNFFNRFLPGIPLHQWRTGFPKPILYPQDMFKFYLQMDPLFAEVRRSAPELHIPTLLFHSPYDLTVPYEHSEWLYNTIPGEANMVSLLDCGHQVFPFEVKGVVQKSLLHHIKTVEKEATQTLMV